jgi:ABC-2 type transport system ATP-binding protein
MSSQAIIEVTDLVKDFILPLSRRKVRSIDGLSFKVEEGGIVGFLGANGAGKTSTIKIIMDLIFPTSGTVKIFGVDHSVSSVKQNIGFLTERPYFYDYLTAREFLKFCAGLFKDSEAFKRIDPLLEEVGLAHAADRPLRRFSKGMLQRVGIAQALINNPKLIILDEPMSGLDPDGRADISRIIENSNKRGATVFFSTHLLPDVEHLCDRVIMINKGKLVVESRVSDLLSGQSKGFVLEVHTKQSQFKDIIKSTFSTEIELQKGISDTLKEGNHIFRVSPGRPTLEEVYLKLQGKST